MYNPFGSSSRSSSSSVRNLYGSSSNKPVKSTSSSFEFDYAGVKYKCDLPAPCQEAWKKGTFDPGIQFFDCSPYLDDPSYPERAKDVIKELTMKLKRKNEDLENVKSEMNFLERKMLVLNEDASLLQKKNKEAAVDLKKRESGSNSVNKMVVFVVEVCAILFLFK